MTYKVSTTQSFFVEDLTKAREMANTITSIVEPIETVVFNFSVIEDMDTRKRVPLREPEPSIGYKGRQDLATQVMSLAKVINEAGEGIFNLDPENYADQAVILPEGENTYVISFKTLAEAVGASRPDLTNQKDINNVVKKAWAQVLASQADKISFK